MSLFMGIDIGTSGVRAAIFDNNGRQISLCHKEYMLLVDEFGKAELNPDTVFETLMSVVAEAITNDGVKVSNKIEAVGISTQLHSCMVVDEKGEKLTNLLTWADTRAVAQANYIRDNFNCAVLQGRVGTRLQHSMYPLSKILWIKETNPGIFAKAYKFISIKEYVIFKLFNEFVIDISDASASALFNIHKFEWDREILNNVIGMDKSKLGEPVECTYVLKGMKQEYACKMGIRADIPVIIGSGDGVLANLGCGVFDNTKMSCTIGTSGAIRVAVDKPVIDKKQRTWCFCFTKDTWVAGGAINNGGIVLKWLREQDRQNYEREALEEGFLSAYKLLDKYASEVRAGSDGLVFLPFLTGERSPNWNVNARGVMYGLELVHNKKHYIRAALEGVIYKMYSIYEILTDMVPDNKQVIANGGYINSDIWLQIQADIFNRPIAVAGIGEAAVFGAAYLAMYSMGEISSLKTYLPSMEPQRLIMPNQQNSEVYQQKYKVFKDVYSRLFMK